MSCTEIKQFENLLQKHLVNKRIKDVKTISLTKPGEHLGSILYKIDLTLLDKNTNKEEILFLIAKTLPESELGKKIYNVHITCINEIAFYGIIVPTFQEFQRELGINDSDIINCFPKCYAARKNLTNSYDVDDDAVLVLENLSSRGFRNTDTLKGIDLNTTRLILKDIAHLHAVALALKIKKPREFNEKVKKYCYGFVPNNLEVFSEVMKSVVSENEECAQYVTKIHGWGEIAKTAPREPFATLLHEDLWVNNTMQTFKDEKATDNKLVDFQLIDYGSPAGDVFFLLWSSVPQEVLEEHLDNLLKYYHDHLILFLTRHKCDVTPFSYDKFLEEMEWVAPYQIGHSLQFHFMAVNGKKEGNEEKERKEGKEGQAPGIPSAEKLLENISLKSKEKSWYMVRECVKRGWLK